jgi:hypothetical protein
MSLLARQMVALCFLVAQAHSSRITPSELVTSVTLILLLAFLILTLLQHTLLGGINMVDVQPWGGDYEGVIVRNNSVFGAFAEPVSNEAAKGINVEGVIIKYVDRS